MTSWPHARSAPRRAHEPVRVADFVAGLAARQAETDPTPPAGLPESHPAATPSPPRRPAVVPPEGRAPAADAAADAPALPVAPAARPRIAPDPSILGLSRHARGRVGSRLFVWFFVLVYAVIVIQLVVVLWQEA